MGVLRYGVKRGIEEEGKSSRCSSTGRNRSGGSRRWRSGSRLKEEEVKEGKGGGGGGGIQSWELVTFAFRVLVPCE